MLRTITMESQRLIGLADRLSTTVGRACSWLIGGLMAFVCLEVVKRYALNAPSDWALDVSTMFYGSCFMLCGAYTLAQDAHVRGDFIYGRLAPATQAKLDLALYVLFFVPGVVALCVAGWDYAQSSWTIHERSSVAANGPVIYPFKALIPLAGALMLVQGAAEMLRCIACIRDGEWPARLADAAEEDVVEQQLAGSNVDAEALRRAVQALHEPEKRAKEAT